MRRLLVALIATFSCTLTAQAEPTDRRIAGHRVVVTEPDYHGYQMLLIDGKAIHRNDSISIDEVHAFGDVAVAIGSSSAGGNACDAPPFVLSFTRGKKPRFDGPIKACKTVTYKIDGDHIRFESKALEGDDGEAWLWTPTHGFKFSGHVKHEADPTKGWPELTANLHPSELLDLGGIATPLLQLVGKDRKQVLPLINGVGSGEFVGDLYVGSACRPHACPDAGIIIIADRKAKQLYVAWKLERKRIVERSTDAAAWPKSVRAEFDKWAKQRR